MLRFLLSIEEEELGDNVAKMIAMLQSSPMSSSPSLSPSPSPHGQSPSPYDQSLSRSPHG